MKNLKQIRDSDLLLTTKKLVDEERLKTLEVIEYLQEIYDRRLHLKSGFASIHEYLVKELRYSDGAAHRRISAMRITQELPEVKQAIAEGKLSLTVVSMAHVFFKKEKGHSKDEKLKVLNQLEGASKLECERELAKLSTQTVPEEKLTIVLDEELKQLLHEFRELSCISDSNETTLIKKALKAAVDKLKQTLRRKTPPAEQTEPATGPETETVSRYIPRQYKQDIWKEAGSRCQFTDPITKRRCTATYHLQLEHLKPFALGGTHTQDNLKLFCRAHNTLTAMQVYGQKKINEFYKTQSSLKFSTIKQALQLSNL